MYLEEKIDQLTKQFNQLDFSVPFTGWVEVMKKIESRFIIKQNSNNHFCNWADNIKYKTTIKTLCFTNFNSLAQLNENENYWIIVVIGNVPTSRHYIYNAKPKAIQALISLASYDFYIVDKKYHWLSYFRRDSVTNTITLYRSGDNRTPFDE